MLNTSLAAPSYLNKSIKKFFNGCWKEDIISKSDLRSP